MYKIREYDIKDKEKVIELWLQICIEEHGFNEWEEELKELNDNSYEKIVVVTHENDIVGTIAYKNLNEEMAELKRVYLHKEHRGKGLAKQMLENMIEYIKKNEYRKILVETWEKFESGRRFYEKNDFILENIDGEVYNYALNL